MGQGRFDDLRKFGAVSQYGEVCVCLGAVARTLLVEETPLAGRIHPVKGGFNVRINETGSLNRRNARVCLC